MDKSIKKGMRSLQGHGRREIGSGSRTEGKREKMMSKEPNRQIKREIK